MFTNNNGGFGNDDEGLVACKSCGKLCFGKCPDCSKAKISLNSNQFLFPGNVEKTARKQNKKTQNNISYTNAQNMYDANSIYHTPKQTYLQPNGFYNQNFAQNFLKKNDFLMERKSTGGSKIKKNNYQFDSPSQQRTPNFFEQTPVFSNNFMHNSPGKSQYSFSQTPNIRSNGITPNFNTTPMTPNMHVPNNVAAQFLTPNNSRSQFDQQNVQRNSMPKKQSSARSKPSPMQVLKKKLIKIPIKVNYNVSPENMTNLLRITPIYTHHDFDKHIESTYLLKKMRKDSKK